MVTPLSKRRWKVSPPKFGKFRAGSMNELIARYFVKPARPVDAVTKIVTKLNRMGWEFPPSAKNHERGYVQMRVYELRRRGLMEVSE